MDFALHHVFIVSSSGIVLCRHAFPKSRSLRQPHSVGSIIKAIQEMCRSILNTSMKSCDFGADSHLIFRSDPSLDILCILYYTTTDKSPLSSLLAESYCNALLQTFVLQFDNQEDFKSIFDISRFQQVLSSKMKLVADIATQSFIQGVVKVMDISTLAIVSSPLLHVLFGTNTTNPIEFQMKLRKLLILNDILLDELKGTTLDWENDQRISLLTLSATSRMLTMIHQESSTFNSATLIPYFSFIDQFQQPLS